MEVLKFSSVYNMAGGLFPGYPFKFNIKCIIFTAFIAGGYWYLPHKNLLVLAFLLWFPYIALAWYDYAYKCEPHLGPTLIPLGQYFWLPFKPPSYKAEYAANKELQQSYQNLDHIIGWTILASITTFFILKKMKRQ
jgi:hypothetical protein